MVTGSVNGRNSDWGIRYIGGEENIRTQTNAYVTVRNVALFCCQTMALHFVIAHQYSIIHIHTNIQLFIFTPIFNYSYSSLFTISVASHKKKEKIIVK